MKAVRLDRPGDVQVLDLPDPKPAEDEALIAVAYAGICGSDVDLLTGRRPAPYVRYPVVPGHEWSGTVLAVGAHADAGLVGRKVVGRGFVACGHCPACLLGDEVLCAADYDEVGFTRPGAWAEQLVIPARQLHVLTDEADLRAAAGLEPAACAADAILRAGVTAGQRIAVVGAGTIGCLAIQMLRGLSPAELLVVEPHEGRRDIAARCGATRSVDPTELGHLAERYDVVIEAAGARTSATDAVTLARRGGCIVLTGIPEPTATLRVETVVSKRLSIHTVFGARPASWQFAAAAFAAGELDPSLLVTHVLPLSEAARGLQLLVDGRDLTGKVLLSTASSASRHPTLSAGPRLP
ncbi:MAG: zinc-binding dehydrogenase [Mycobacteriales bacterium]